MQVRARRESSFEGYDTSLGDRMRAVPHACVTSGTRLIDFRSLNALCGAARRRGALEPHEIGVRVANHYGRTLSAAELDSEPNVPDNPRIRTARDATAGGPRAVVRTGAPAPGIHLDETSLPGAQ
jgi:hypothetical protein